MRFPTTLGRLIAYDEPCGMFWKHSIVVLDARDGRNVSLLSGKVRWGQLRIKREDTRSSIIITDIMPFK